MANAKRTEITIETLRRTVITSRRSNEYIYCRQCGTLVVAMSMLEAAALYETGTEEIAIRLKTGEMHSVEQEGRTLRICGAALSQ